MYFEQHPERWLYAVIVAALVVAGMIIARAAHGHWENVSAEWPNLSDAQKSWFKSVRSPHGIPCCDIADGHRTDYEIRPDGYWVPIAEKLRHVPPEAIVHNAGNPVGEAIVWYVQQGQDTYYIRCFVPGGGV